VGTLAAEVSLATGRYPTHLTQATNAPKIPQKDGGTGRTQVVLHQNCRFSVRTLKHASHLLDK